MLWLFDQVENISLSDALPFLPLLSTERRERILSITHPPTKLQSILAEVLLQYALRQEYGMTVFPRIEIGEKGKPFFPDHREIHFNLSHCLHAVACALDAAPLGVDVQEVRTLRREGNLKSVPSVFRVLSEEELSWITAAESIHEQDRRFTAIWTCKEAYGKAIGDGILYELNSTSFLPKKRPWQQYGLVFRNCEYGDTFLTLCSEHSLRLRRVSFPYLQTLLPEV